MIFSLTGPLDDDQLFLDFEIAEPVSEGVQPVWHPIRGLVDTGAQDSHIHSAVTARLKLPLLSHSNVSGVNADPVKMEVRRAFTRWSSVEGQRLCKPFQMKVGMGIDPKKAEALIGMDMIKFFTLTVVRNLSYKMVADLPENVIEHIM